MNFQLRSLSLTFYKYLESARLLIGKNIFKRSPARLLRRNIAKDEDFKIQEYYGRCDKQYFQGGSDKFSISLLKYKRILNGLFEPGRGLLFVTSPDNQTYEEMLKLAVADRLMTQRFATSLKTYWAEGIAERIGRIREAYEGQLYC